MPNRLRLHDLRNSRFPRILGYCQDDLPRIAQAANSIQETLLYDKTAGNESWSGTWSEVAFNMTRDQPFVTLPRNIARLEGIVVCDKPVELNNQFFEYLRFGNGRMTQNRCGCENALAVYSRNNAVTFHDLTNPPQSLRAYFNNAQDVGKRVLFQGLDANDKTVYSQDVLVVVDGVFVPLASPFATTALTFNRIQGIQKDLTVGPVDIYQVDPTTGDEELLLTMEPSETTAGYRRYFFNNLPPNCCPVPNTSAGTIQVKALAKMELVPMLIDTDYALLQSREAFIAEAQCYRLSEADTPSAQAMAARHHQRAIQILIGELGHYHGVRDPAVGFYPFGSARFEKVDLGMR